jgi:hypothetical protein
MSNNDDIDEPWKTMKAMADAIGQTQALNRANSYILMEIVRDLARTTVDPHKYISDMFERISARADQGEIEGEAHPVSAEFRDQIARFFSKAAHGLAKRD